MDSHFHALMNTYDYEDALFRIDPNLKDFRDFASLLEKFEDPIVNSFIMVKKIGNGKIYDARLSNGPIESINRKVKDLKRLGRGFRNFEHFRNRFLFATRQNPVLNGTYDCNPVTYYEDDDF